MATADDILVARARQDFEDGLVHTRKTLRAKHGMIVGGTLDALVMGAVAALHLRTRLPEDVAHLLELAHRVAKGEDPAPLAEAHVDRVLRLKSKMHLIAREDDPAFGEIRAMATALFARRLPDLARLAIVPDPIDYDDLVRKAFPERAHVDAIVADNARSVETMIVHLEKHPHVLRVPASMAPRIAASAREMVTWKLAEVRAGVDAIYST